jgi:DNA-binding IclR family transcriptional regulator
MKQSIPLRGSVFHNVEFGRFDGMSATMGTSGGLQKRAESRAGIQVVDRAVAVMRALAEADGPQRLRDIAEQTGLSPSTSRRILASLAQHQLCEQTPEGTYRLGLALFELGRRVEADLDIRSRSLPALKRLSEESHLTAFSCVQRDDRAIAIERVDGRYAFSLALTVGGSLPLHAGAAPRALLAYVPEDEVRRMLEQEQRERFTDRTLLEREEILADMRSTRERGYVVSDEDVTPGVAAIGMPVFGHLVPDRPVAAISVAGLVPQVLGKGFDALLGQLCEAAEEISRELGHGLGEGGAPAADARPGAAA